VRKPVPEKAPQAPGAQGAKVTRYRTGKAPEWLEENKEDTPTFAALGSTKVEVSTADRRLDRLGGQNDEPNDEEERVERHKRRLQETMVITEAKEEEPQEKNEAQTPRTIIQPEVIELAKEPDLEARREKARRLAQEVAEAEAETLAKEEENEDEEEDEEASSEEEESSEEEVADWEQFSTAPKIPPKFVSKEKRQTLTEKEQVEQEKEKVKQAQEQASEERRQRTLKNLKETLAREKDVTEMHSEEIDDSEEEDEQTQEKEFELWKLRELQRIKRDKEEREKWKEEQQDIERRRAMTDEELQREKARLKEGVKEERHMKFLQKYYHKGAFYTEEFKSLKNTHDWLAPTGEDRSVDKTLLPGVLQVKNFGRAGRTKYTHLKDQDTTKWDDPWMTAASTGNVQKKMGGLHGGFDRPTKRRKVDT